MNYGKSSKPMRAIYWFKRDLRISDNKTFSEACENSKVIIPIFMFTPELLERFNCYDHRLGFVVECVKRLSLDISKRGGCLFCYYDEPLKVFERLIKRYKPDVLYTN